MTKSAAKLATFAIAGSLMVGSGVLKVDATNVYDSTAVAGIALSVNNYVESIEDTTPAVTSEAATEASADTTEANAETTETKKKSKKHAKLVVANVENVVNVRKKGTTDSKIVGQMYKGDAGKVLKKGDGWTKIKSGNCVGWVKNDFLLFGEEAYAHAEKVCHKVATVNTTTLNVRAGKSTDSDVVTLVPMGGEYTVKKSYDGWYKIAIDEDCKGYVSADYVDVEIEYGEALTMKEIEEIEAANRAAEAAAAQAAADAAAAQAAQTTQQQTTTTTVTAEKSVSTIKPTKKAASTSSSSSSSNSSSSFSSDSSVSSTSTSSSSLGSDIANYALQFVGNPYVYGGTSLTNGTDCSGFTMSVYAHFGYSLSRTAAAQSGNGTNVSFGNLQPGDLVFYNNGGGIGHVALYIGNGQVVHASNAKTGIKVSAYNYRTPCKAVRIIK